MLPKIDSVIRKISVGADYKNSMVYCRGQKLFNGEYEICSIEKNEINGNIIILIASKSRAVLLWKEFSVNMPISIEFYIDYESTI